MNNILAINIIEKGIEKIVNQPPKKTIVIITDIAIILAYSAKKNKANPSKNIPHCNQKLILPLPPVNQKELYLFLLMKI